MTIPAWDGPDVVGVCSECGRKANIPDPDCFGTAGNLGHCSGCKRQVEFDCWRGPVTVVS